MRIPWELGVGVLLARLVAFRGDGPTLPREPALFDQLTQIGLLLAEMVKRLFDAHEALPVVVSLDGHGYLANGNAPRRAADQSMFAPDNAAVGT